MDTKIHELPNGIRVVHKYIPYTRAVHCGFIINTGSRDDLDDQMGMAHFIEHMVFKGTAKRKTYHILNYLESVGGDLNAYTTKDKICLYASMVSDYFGRATELLTDITFHSTFPSQEIVKEKQVISEEIDMYRDMHDEAIFEDFDDMIYPEHSLGKPILGTKSSISTFTQDHLRAHLKRTFLQGNVVYGIVGNVQEREVKAVIDKYLAPLELPTGETIRMVPNLTQGEDRKVEISTGQCHEIIGGRAYAMRKGHYVPFLLMDNLLGGPAMNSRLNLNIREKHGLTYSISSFYRPYQDSGMWGIYFACERKNLGKIRKLVEKELKSLADKKLGILQLSQAKKQLIGQITLGYENLLNQMLGDSKDLLDWDEISPFSDYVEAVESVTAAQIQDAAQEIFRHQQVSRITYLAG
ncbi:pitrilysin family protein [Pontibacter sp. G13]|uniref:M16 family metallopeptidase n=1 Tax=Pontibacter sp. G13 TaxID=3074898 RepID=UPI00288A24F3|nr:pitrilysin family protein [Pontibacter sp. G13]WNJ16003.1 pitrilysin family protein [Pontibacter sp. G13]